MTFDQSVLNDQSSYETGKFKWTLNGLILPYHHFKNYQLLDIVSKSLEKLGFGSFQSWQHPEDPLDLILNPRLLPQQLKPGTPQMR